MKSNKDEADGEHRVEGKDHGASGIAGSGQIKGDHNNNNGDTDVDGMGNGNVSGDVHANIDDRADGDAEEMADRCARGNPAGDSIVVDWLQGEYCFECNSTSGQILFCSENGCPVVFHEACMTWTPKFDEMGKFYCPYCLYKQEVARLKELRQKAMLAEKELSEFICLRRDGGNEKEEGEMVSFKRASVSTMAREVSFGGDRGNGLNDDGNETIYHNQDATQVVESMSKENPLEHNISRANEFNNVQSRERLQEEEDEMVHLEGASVSTMTQKVSPGDCGNGLNDDDKVTTHHNQDEIQVVESMSKEKSYEGNISTTPGSDNVGNGESIQEDIENPNSEDDENNETEPLLPNAVETTFHGCQKHDKQTANKASPLKVVSQDDSSFQPSSSANNMDLNHEERNTGTAKTSAKWQKSTKRPLMPTVGTEKRRRLHWTAEEEDMLKELMQEYSTKGNKNTPWRKILEHGRSVFHSTRLPVDLKDKWKNIVAKEISKK